MGCPEQDSNLHASQHSHLKRARLPFRHLGLSRCYLQMQCKGMGLLRDVQIFFGFFGIFALMFCALCDVYGK